jgi:hypothetical protein
MLEIFQEVRLAGAEPSFHQQASDGQLCVRGPDYPIQAFQKMLLRLFLLAA